MQGASGGLRGALGVARFVCSKKKQQLASTFLSPHCSADFCYSEGRWELNAKVGSEQVLHFLLGEKARKSHVAGAPIGSVLFVSKGGAKEKKSGCDIFQCCTLITLTQTFERTILLILLQRRRSDSNPSAVLSPTAGHGEECRVDIESL